MKELALILQLMSYMPAIHSRPPAPPPAAVTGQGLLLIAACQPGQAVIIQPGNLSGIAGNDGVARIPAPAQADTADPYVLYIEANTVAFHGTLSADESLSAVCP